MRSPDSELILRGISYALEHGDMAEIPGLLTLLIKEDVELASALYDVFTSPHDDLHRSVAVLRLLAVAHDRDQAEGLE